MVREVHYVSCQAETEYQKICHIVESHEALSESVRKLRSIGYKKPLPAPFKLNPPSESEARKCVIEAVDAGEWLLLYDKRLAMIDASIEFRLQKGIIKEWQELIHRKRIHLEISSFTVGIQRLLETFDDQEDQDTRFLIGGIDLPEALQRDFRTARDQFSIGFDDVGLFLAARGLEKVLRQIARNRKIFIEIGGKPEPASEADLHNLIETMARIRWKTKDTPLISKDTKALLQYVRTIRNEGAHSGQRESDTDDSRQKATIIAHAANQLWKDIATTKSKIRSAIVKKNW